MKNTIFVRKLISIYTTLIVLIFASTLVVGQTQFVRHINNPIFSGTPNSWASNVIVNSSIVYDGKYHLYYTAGYPDASRDISLGYARSVDGISWEKVVAKPILQSEEKWEEHGIYDAIVVMKDAVWHMWYACPTDEELTDMYLGYATSTNGIKWKKKGGKLNFSKSLSGWDSGGIFPQSIVYDGEKFIMYYKGYGLKDGITKEAIGIAESVDGTTWIKDKANNPILEMDENCEMYSNIKNLSVTYDINSSDHPFQMYYITYIHDAEVSEYVYNAKSWNGRVWEKSRESVLSNKEDSWAEDGYKDIEVVKVGKNYKMWLNGNIGSGASQTAIGYVEDFSNTCHCTSLECGNKYKTNGGVPEDFMTWVCTDLQEKVYVWGRIECNKGSEIQIHKMYKSSEKGSYQIKRRIHCNGEKFYNFSSYITSDVQGEDVLFDSKNFFVEKFTTVLKPQVQVAKIKKIHNSEEYIAKFSLVNKSNTVLIKNSKIRLSPFDESITQIIPNEINFGNIEIKDSCFSAKSVEISVNEEFTSLPKLKVDIYSEDVLYWSDIISLNTAVAVEENSLEIPIEFELSQNYPNPFNPSTTLKYEIANESNVVLKIFDVLGREVEILVNKQQKPGYYEINWNALNNSSGVYFYKIQAGDFVDTKKMLLLR